jgi:eukaryotic-like serine/threonine-protein kinase
MADLRDRLATSLDGAYTLENELGGGGMARVFVAEEVALSRKVVIKLLSPELAEGLSTERFIREIKLAARLRR